MKRFILNVNSRIAVEANTIEAARELAFAAADNPFDRTPQGEAAVIDQTIETEQTVESDGTFSDFADSLIFRT